MSLHDPCAAGWDCATARLCAPLAHVRAGGDSAAKPHHAKLPLLLRSLTRIAISLGRGEPSVGRRLSACGCETVLDPAADVGRLRADERLPERVRPRDLT